MRRRGLTVVVCAAALALAGTVPASASIRVQKGIAGVYIGMTQDQMRDRLGMPIHTHQGMNDFGAWTRFVFRGRIAVMFQGNERVTSIFTSGRSQRTSSGVGVGSRARSLRRHVHHLRCQKIKRSRSCYVGRFEPGRRVTVFKLRKSRVARVTIGLVID